ncbi:MAG: FliH/SctL family protein [Lachnospirales bacterium]
MSKIVKASNIILDGSKAVIDVGYTNSSVTVSKAKGKMNEISNILEASKIQAKKIVEDAQIKAEAIIEEEKKRAYDLGFEEGYNEGLTQGNAEGYGEGLRQTEQLRSEAKQTLDEASLEKMQIIDNVEIEVVDVIKDVVGNLLDSYHLIDDKVILHLVKRGLKNATVVDKVTVKVSESDYPIVLDEIDELKKIIDSSKIIEVIKDFTLEKNDCLIDTEYGAIDCSLKDIKTSLINNLTLILEER